MVRPEKTLQRSVCYWIVDKKVEEKVHEEEEDIEDGDEDEADLFAASAQGKTSIDTEEVVIKYGVPQKLFIDFLSKEIASAESCQSLPFTLLLVISYAALAINHDDAALVNAVEDSIGFDITDNANFAFSNDVVGHKNIHDVNTHADFWSWMARGFCPLLWVQEYNLAEGRNWSEPYVQQASEMYSRSDRGVLLHYNRIILGVRMSQERDVPLEDGTHSTACDVEKLDKFYDKDCVGPRPYDLEPETFEARKTTNPTRVHWLYINDDLEFVRQQLVQMEKTGWLDEHTRKVELAFPVYNAEYGLHTMFISCFFFSRGGHIWKDIIPLSAYAQNWNSFRSVFYDFTWVLCMAYVFLTEIAEIFEVVREYGPLGIVQQYVGFWNAVDWLSVWSGLVIMSMFFTNMNNIGAMNVALQALGEIDEGFFRTQYREQGKRYVSDLETEIQYAYTFRMIQALYPLVIMLRLFKAFGSQPRLAVVTKTLHGAWIDLTHFLIIFCSVFFTYAVAGVVLFGIKVPAFTNMFRSMIACFRCMFGDFDWEEMRKVGRLDAFLWFLPFVILIVMILLNMLIAIVMDAYDEVITGLDHEDNIWELMKKAYEKSVEKFKKEKVPMTEVIRGMRAKIKEDAKRKAEEDEGQDLGDEVDSDDSDDDKDKNKVKISGGFTKKRKRMKATKQQELDNNVTISSLKELFTDTMHTSQAKTLIREAILHFYAANKEVGDINEVLTTIGRIDYRTKRLRQKVKDRVQAEGLACNHPQKVNDTSRDVFGETDGARQDLDGWLPEDEDDVILPNWWLHPPVIRSSEDIVEEMIEAGNEPKKDGLLHIVKHYTGRESGTGSKVAPNLNEGGTLQVLPNEELMLKACRDAGLANTYDHLRKQAVGRYVQVVSRDDDGTVMCRIPNVGEVWFAATAFVPTLMARHKDEPDDSTTYSDTGGEALEGRAAELEQEVSHGKEVVEECLTALKTLHDDLMKMKADKRKGIDKFQQYRHQAVALQRGNVAEKERFKECQARVKQVTSERDTFFEQVKKLVQENRELEEAAVQAESRNAGARSHSRPRR